jgi:hypothetical protein
MRRDHFTLTATNAGPDSATEPTLQIRYDGPVGGLTARLEDDAGELPEGRNVDAAFRLQGDPAEEGASGVFGLTRRLTGSYLLEVDADADDVFRLVDAARDADGDYQVCIERPDGTDVTLRLETLLVYDQDGSLRRQNSLVPGGVEL